MVNVHITGTAFAFIFNDDGGNLMFLGVPRFYFFCFLSRAQPKKQQTTDKYWKGVPTLQKDWEDTDMETYISKAFYATYPCPRLEWLVNV